MFSLWPIKRRGGEACALIGGNSEREREGRCICIYIDLYVDSPHGPWFGELEQCFFFPVFCAFVCLVDLVAQLGGVTICGDMHVCIHM